MQVRQHVRDALPEVVVRRSQALALKSRTKIGSGSTSSRPDLGYRPVPLASTPVASRSGRRQ
jgi:hypothetical protein